MNSKPNEEQCAELQCAELTNAETNFTTSATMTSLPIDVSSQAIESQPQCDGQECGVSQEKKMIKKKSQGGIQAHHPLHARPMTANDTSTTAPAMQAASPAASSTSRKCDRALSNTKPNEEKDTIPRYMGGLMFPMKLHLMLERCESERSKRKINASTTNASKRQKTGKDENQNMDKDNIIIGWLPSGNAFKIYDEERFVREIMPSYFSGSSQPQEQCSFEDFQRSLNLWGFTDMPCVEGPVTRKIHVCSHPKFHRRQPSACRAMRFRSMIQRGFVPLELCLEMEQPKADDLERVSERVFQTASGGLDGGLHKKERILPSE